MLAISQVYVSEGQYRYFYSGKTSQLTVELRPFLRAVSQRRKGPDKGSHDTSLHNLLWQQMAPKLHSCTCQYWAWTLIAQFLSLQCVLVYPGLCGKEAQLRDKQRKVVKTYQQWNQCVHFRSRASAGSSAFFSQWTDVWLHRNLFCLGGGRNCGTKGKTV